MPISLSLANLDAISARAKIPGYSRNEITPGILHFGIGNFHRAHQAVYLDRLFGLGLDRDWGLVGAGVTAHDSAMRGRLAQQDYLTTVVEQTAEATTIRVTGAMVDFLDPNDQAAIIAKLADPAIRIVSMTITEGGYFINPASGEFDSGNPAILADAREPDNPGTVFGLILAGIRRRRAAGIQAFTVMSCDNIPGNGHTTMKTVAGLARLSDPDLADWITDHMYFPNSMVDRITPATGKREIENCRTQFDMDDRSPVYCEEFSQWVLEDRFSAGRPALEKVGVTFVDDVTPYELMKIRILNGSHASIAYAGELLDIHFVHDAMSDPDIASFLRRLVHDDIIPVVPPVPDTDMGDYFETVRVRFANPRIADTIARLAYDGSNRQPKFIVPAIRDALDMGGSIAGLALVSALWCRYCHGRMESGRRIDASDPVWDRLTEAASKARANPLEWIGMRDIYGDLASAPEFVEAFSTNLESLWENGTRATLSRYGSARNRPSG
ncbi:MAG: mannitol dehydrogenase family protein [Pseudorhodobacter sp.]